MTVPPSLQPLNGDGDTFAITAETVVIGRDPGCDLVVGHKSASRRHAEILLRDQQWLISDLDSRNGTLVNNRRVGRDQVLRPGDNVTIAGDTWTFVLDDDPLATIDSDADQPADLGRVRLSPRELEVIALIASGATDPQIAATLLVSVTTVRSHLDRIRDKTGCRRRSQLTRLALDLGL